MPKILGAAATGAVLALTLTGCLGSDPAATAEATSAPTTSGPVTSGDSATPTTPSTATNSVTSTRSTAIAPTTARKSTSTPKPSLRPSRATPASTPRTTPATQVPVAVERQAVAATVSSFLSAGFNKQSAKFCALMSPAAQSRAGGGAACRAAFPRLARKVADPKAATSGTFFGWRVPASGAAVTGATAVYPGAKYFYEYDAAKTSNPGSVDLHLVKLDGQWLIERF